MYNLETFLVSDIFFQKNLGIKRQIWITKIFENQVLRYKKCIFRIQWPAYKQGRDDKNEVNKTSKEIGAHKQTLKKFGHKKKT